ncbi:MAG: hypothetical protein HFH57_09390 [Lachnospiraceae bacterium]|nr:hypothetical protein [Lachnospiraceae bacterium]
MQLNIHLDYIPPYSPNLNLIKRVWNLVKGESSSRSTLTYSNKKSILS